MAIFIHLVDTHVHVVGGVGGDGGILPRRIFFCLPREIFICLFFFITQKEVILQSLNIRDALVDRAGGRQMRRSATI